MLTVNKRDMLKVAATSIHLENNPVVWTSKYGSITFNQFGREFPLGGINEAGLVIETLWLEESTFPSVKDPKKPCINGEQWLQYVLDNYANIQELIDNINHIQISARNFAKIHFFTSDHLGKSAALEYLNGTLIISKNDQSPPVLTNSTYENSLAYLKRGSNSSDSTSSLSPFQKYSLKRFSLLANLIKKISPQTREQEIKLAFDILKQVSHPTTTQWAIVYECEPPSLHYYHCRNDNAKIKTIDLSSLNFSCSSPVEIIDLTGEITAQTPGHFIPYSLNLNRRLLKLWNLSLSQWLGFSLSPLEIEYLAQYPESTIPTIL